MIRYLCLFIVILTFSNLASSNSSTDFQNWSLLCGDKGNCSLSQIVSQDPNGKRILLGANINYSVSRDFPVLILRLPPSIHQQSGVGLKVDDHPALQLPISQCAPSACQSVIKLDQQLMDEMIKGDTMLVAIAIEQHKQLTLPLKLGGLKSGVLALQASNKEN